MAQLRLFPPPGDDNLYVVDTGNSRIKVLSKNLDFRNHIFNENLEGRSVTGVCLGSSGDTLLTVNWRTKTITEMNLDGRTLGGQRGEGHWGTILGFSSLSRIPHMTT